MNMFQLFRQIAVPVIMRIMIIAAPAAAITLTAGEQQSSVPPISQGDSVFVRGIATGHPANGLQVWLIGNNYAKVTTVSVNADNSYEYELKRADTQNLAPGQYFVLVQHPMMNGEFDIVYNAGTGEVINQQMINTGTGTGTVLFRLTGAGSLQGPAAAAALVGAVASQNIDDSITTVSFYVQPAGAFIDPIGDRVAGDRFTITGSTNLAAGDDLLVEVYSSSFQPTTKAQSGEFSGTSGMVKVQQGSAGYNRWSFDIDTAGWRPDEYIVSVSAVLQNVKGSTTFTLTEQQAPAAAAPAGTRAAPNLPVTVATTRAAPVATTQKASLPVAVIPAGALTALILFRRAL